MPADAITISLALPGFRVTQPTSEPDGYVIWVEPSSYGALCPRCGRASADYHDGSARTVRDVPILGYPVYLRVWQPRFTGHACGKPLNEPLEAIAWEQRHTHRSQQYLIRQSRISACQSSPISGRCTEDNKLAGSRHKGAVKVL